ncbi:MAG: sorbosone dehydrogenase family protein, partial [Gammaproteobacteria bacterium]
MRLFRVTYIAVVLTIAGCASNAELPVSAGIGPDPELPAPRNSLLPLVNVADVARWKGDAKPIPAAGLAVSPFATGLDHPRWLYLLPNGDVLVAETNAQSRKAKGIYDRVQKAVLKRAGAGVESADRITLLRDADGDGIAEIRTVFLSDLTSPFGMSLIGDRFYVANTYGVVSFPYTVGETAIVSAGTPLTLLPAGEINHHWTKNLVASPDGQYLYASVGSN